MKVIGITGGIASGKSTVSSFIVKHGYALIDADIVAREIVEPDMPAYNDIVNHFGKDIVLVEGALNRKALGAIVFNNPQELKRLNEITHPRIIDRIKELIEKYKLIGKQLIFLDAALLIEMNLLDLVDDVWLITLNKEEQIKRLMSRDGIDKDLATKKIDSQMSLDDKRKYATKEIDNSYELQDTLDQLSRLIALERGD